MSWFGILNLFALGMRFLDRKYLLTNYFTRASYAMYLFHQSYVVIWGYMFVKSFSSILLNYFLIVVLSFVSTMLTYEVTKRIRITRAMFGIK